MFPLFSKIGPIAITSFGLSLACAFLISLFLSYRAIRDRVDVSIEEVFDVLVSLTIGTLIGARAVYILLHPDVFGSDILSYVLIRERPGLSFVGGLCGAFVMFVILGKLHKKFPWAKIADRLTPTLIVVLAIGQFGSFLDGFSFGRPTRYPWGVSLLGSQVRLHPLPLYMLVFLLSSLFIFKKVQKRAAEKRWTQATVFLLFGASYGLFSALVDTLRTHIVTLFYFPLDRFVMLFLFLFFAAVSYKANRSFKQDFRSTLAIIRRRKPW